MMNRAYNIFLDQATEVTREFPSLTLDQVDDKPFLKGELAVVDYNGRHWDKYTVEIHPSDEFPQRFPLLYETGGKIPKIGDWHVYEDVLYCCIKIEPAEIIRCKKGITLAEFIREEVMPYLFNQTHRRVEGYYVNGEYGHGVHGIFEFYRDLLRTGDDVHRTVLLMRYIALVDTPQRTSACFCGSGLKYRHCHRDAFKKCKEIGENIVGAHAEMIDRANSSNS